MSRRTVSIIRWTFTLAAIGVALAWCWTLRYWAYLRPFGEWRIGLAHGTFALDHGPAMENYLVWQYGTNPRIWAFWWFRFATDQKTWGLLTPLWMPLSLTAIPSVLLTWADIRKRHRDRIGLCPSCGYDRRGLAADAKCPECGAT